MSHEHLSTNDNEHGRLLPGPPLTLLTDVQNLHLAAARKLPKHLAIYPFEYRCTLQQLCDLRSILMR